MHIGKSGEESFREEWSRKGGEKRREEYWLRVEKKILRRTGREDFREEFSICMYRENGEEEFREERRRSV